MAEEETPSGAGCSLIAEVIALAEVLMGIGDQENTEADKEAGE